MAVVVITGILAVAGVSLFRQQVVASRGTEAASTIQAIRAAQEAYAAENHVYLDVSQADEKGSWYPNPTPNKTYFAWAQPGHVDYPRWQALAPAVNRAVRFGYLVNAGEAGTSIDNLRIADKPSFPSPMAVGWYTIQARGDTDGNSVSATYAATSLNGELSIENQGE